MECTRCGKKLKESEAVWLELDQRTDTYTSKFVPQNSSQGGFPKSHNISVAIDKAAGVEREVVGHHDIARRNKPENRRNISLNLPVRHKALRLIYLRYLEQHCYLVKNMGEIG